MVVVSWNVPFSLEIWWFSLHPRLRIPNLPSVHLVSFLKNMRKRLPLAACDPPRECVEIYSFFLVCPVFGKWPHPSICGCMITFSILLVGKSPELWLLHPLMDSCSSFKAWILFIFTHRESSKKSHEYPLLPPKTVNYFLKGKFSFQIDGSPFPHAKKSQEIWVRKLII